MRVGTHALFLILDEKLSIFPVEYNVTYGFAIHDLYYNEVCFFFTHSVKDF